MDFFQKKIVLPFAKSMSQITIATIYIWVFIIFVSWQLQLVPTIILKWQCVWKVQPFINDHLYLAIFIYIKQLSPNQILPSLAQIPFKYCHVLLAHQNLIKSMVSKKDVNLFTKIASRVQIPKKSFSQNSEKFGYSFITNDIIHMFWP